MRPGTAACRFGSRPSGRMAMRPRTADIQLRPSADGSVILVHMPFAIGAAEILRSVGARWRKSAGAWSVPADRKGDVECRLPDLRALLDKPRRQIPDYEIASKKPTKINARRRRFSAFPLSD